MKYLSLILNKLRVVFSLLFQFEDTDGGIQIYQPQFNSMEENIKSIKFEDHNDEHNF